MSSSAPCVQWKPACALLQGCPVLAKALSLMKLCMCWPPMIACTFSQMVSSRSHVQNDMESRDLSLYYRKLALFSLNSLLELPGANVGLPLNLTGRKLETLHYWRARVYRPWQSLQQRSLAQSRLQM